MHNIPTLIFHATISALRDVRRLIRVWINLKTYHSQRGEGLRSMSRHCILQNTPPRHRIRFPVFWYKPRLLKRTRELGPNKHRSALFFSIDSALKFCLHESILVQFSFSLPSILPISFNRVIRYTRREVFSKYFSAIFLYRIEILYLCKQYSMI